MITSSDPSMTYSDPKVTYIDPKHLLLPRELGRVHGCLSLQCFAAGGRNFNALLGAPVALQAVVLPENTLNTAKSGLFRKI